MSKEDIILEKISKLKKDMEILTNPLHNNAGCSTLWTEVYNKLDEAQKILLKDKRIYGW